jgi:transposase-like protein
MLNEEEHEELFLKTPKAQKSMCLGIKKDKPITKEKKSATITCPHCLSLATKKHANYNGRKRYKCLSCLKTFNELTGTSISKTRYPEKWQKFIDCMVAGLSVAKTAKKISVSVPTAFSWRHKLLEKYEKKADLKLYGIVEADETFFLFSEKGNKSVSKRRKARKRGGTAQKPGISDEQVPVIVGCDRDGNVILGVAGMGRISLADVENVFKKYIDSDGTLCTDSHSSFKAYAKAYNLSYVGLNISKGRRIVNGTYHIQNVNNSHSRLKQWMSRFNGVSTKYLQNYMNWFSLLEETKESESDQSKEFIKRSVPSIL